MTEINYLSKRAALSEYLKLEAGMETVKSNPIRLRFESREQVVVIPDDEDRFVITEGEAARACKRAVDDKEWKEQFDPFLLFIHDWCEEHASDVKAGYVTIGDIGLNVLICIKSKDYSFDIEDTLVELDFALADQFPSCETEVMQIPNQDTLTDVLSSEAMMVYGDSEGT